MNHRIVRTAIVCIFLSGLALALQAGGGPSDKMDLIKPGLDAGELMEMMGPPESSITMGGKSILKWPQLKVTVVDAKVSAVQVLEPQQTRAQREEEEQVALRKQQALKERRQRLEEAQLKQQALRNDLAMQSASKATIEKLEKEAEAGDPQAQYALAKAYRSGRGIPMDKHLAIWWFSKAAGQAHPASQYHLGLMYLNGEGVPQNFSTARNWLIEAADRDHARAQFTLGTLHAEGKGLNIDYRQAYIWFSLAIMNGNQNAKTHRDHIEGFLTEEEITDASNFATLRFMKKNQLLKETIRP